MFKWKWYKTVSVFFYGIAGGSLSFVGFVSGSSTFFMESRVCGLNEHERDKLKGSLKSNYYNNLKQRQCQCYFIELYYTHTYIYIHIPPFNAFASFRKLPYVTTTNNTKKIVAPFIVTELLAIHGGLDLNTLVTRQTRIRPALLNYILCRMNLICSNNTIVYENYVRYYKYCIVWSLVLFK